MTAFAVCSTAGAAAAAAFFVGALRVVVFFSADAGDLRAAIAGASKWGFWGNPMVTFWARETKKFPENSQDFG
jgi:hypothetical protein